MKIPQRIVAEISKNWLNGEECAQTGLLSEQFEHAIAVNANRGYVLESWQFNRIDGGKAAGEAINETIIAVFVEMKASK